MKRALKMSLLRYLLALGAGFALSFAYAPYNLGWLAWFFPVVFFALLWSVPQEEGRKARSRNFWRGFRIAYVCGFGFWVKDASLLGAPSENAGWLVAGLGALYLALFLGLFGGWSNAFLRPRAIEPREQPAFRILGFAVLNGFLWCGIEWARGLGRVSTGWDALGVSFIDSGFIIAQAADLFGVNSLTFLPVFGGAVLVETLRSFHMEAKHSFRRVHWEVAVTLLLLCLTFTYGAFRLKAMHKVETFSLRVLLVQQNVPLNYELTEGLTQQIYDGYADEMDSAFLKIHDRASKQIEKAGEAIVETPDLVVWPEAAFPSPIFVDKNGAPYRNQRNWTFFNSEIRPHGDFLFITGVNHYSATKGMYGLYQVNMEEPLYNSIGFFPKGFASYSHKPKNHLMPFGEYLPLEKLALVQKIYEYSAGIEFQGSFTPAKVFEPQPAEVNGNEFSIIPAVCYEDSVSSVVRKYVRDEPQIIVNATNDVWFAGTSCAEKHYQNAKYRAIEYRRPLVRAANTGVSGIVNHTGAALHPYTGKIQELRDGDGSAAIKGSLEGLIKVPSKPIFTLYSRIGDVFCWGGGLVVLIFSIVLSRRNTN